MGDVEPPVAVCHKQTDSSLVFTSHNALYHLITWPPACNSRFSLSGIKLDLYLYNPLHTKLYLLTPPIQCVLMQITTAAMPETQIPLPVGTPRCCEVGLLASSRLGRGGILTVRQRYSGRRLTRPKKEWRLLTDVFNAVVSEIVALVMN